jgi:hypothetical protein
MERCNGFLRAIADESIVRLRRREAVQADAAAGAPR